LLLRDEFSVVSLIADIDVPTTVVFGSADTIVPPDQSRAVARAAAGRVEVVEIGGAEHNDEVMFTGGQLIAAVEALADRSVGPATR
jgi:pimeloyl-ACP methyl ester carboxylesterase